MRDTVNPSHASAPPRLVHVEQLSVGFNLRDHEVLALDDIAFSIAPGERVGIVGESGSGKSTLAMAIAGHIKGSGTRKSGQVQVDGVDMFESPAEKIRMMRLHRFGFIFQNPIGTLDPTRKVRNQFFGTDGSTLDSDTIAKLLHMVGLKNVPQVMAAFPHELSGGMAQRVAIAMAIEHKPALLVADEPTSALDASIRTQILELILAFSQAQKSALLLVSHDLGAVQRYCQRVAVMYAGRIVETGTTEAVFAAPRHPYTKALLEAIPGRKHAGELIRTIGGNTPIVSAPARACTFAPRCPKAVDACRQTRPELEQMKGHAAACLLAGDTAWKETP